MKLLKDHVLLFDAQCPLCSAYSNTFVKAGMLDMDGREAYQEMAEATCIYIDKNKARNEIALVDKKNGTVYYGIDSIFKVISNSFPMLRAVFECAPFYWLMKKVYAFISYNRKVIVPPKKTDDTCVPDLNIKYRITYLLFTWLLSSVILTNYATYLTGVIPASSFYREFVICGGQIVFQSVVMLFLAKKKLWDYLGNMMTVSFAASLVLLIVMGLGKLFLFTNPTAYTLIFLFIAGLMFLEHMRRMKRLGLNLLPSISWVIYRILVLIIIILNI